MKSSWPKYPFSAATACTTNGTAATSNATIATGERAGRRGLRCRGPDTWTSTDKGPPRGRE
ncbi:hypothetical protein GCM10027436_71210 [Actinophytocola sediminis]